MLPRIAVIMTAVASLALVIARTARGEIVVLDSALSIEEQNNYINSPETLTWSAASFGAFSPAGADKLIVTFGIQHSGVPAVVPITNVTYNGQPMTEAVGSGSNTTYESAIFYLDNPDPSTGDLVADMARGYGAGATLWALSGTADGVGDTGVSAGSSASLTTTAANSMVVAHATVAGDAAFPVAQSPLTAAHGTNLFYATAGDARNHSIGTGYQTVATPGTVALNFDIGNIVVAAEFVPADPAVKLVGDSVASNAPPGTLVGTLSMLNANGTFTYSLDTTGDDAYFDISSGTTNLRTAAWIDKASFNISIVGTESGGGGLIVTNDFTITVDAVADARPTFVVSAEVQSGAADGTVVGTAQTIESGATFSIVSGRSDLFYFDGAYLKVTNSADWGSAGTTNYVTLQAVAGSATNELVVAASVVSGATQGTVFLFH